MFKQSFWTAIICAATTVYVERFVLGTHSKFASILKMYLGIHASYSTCFEHYVQSDDGKVLVERESSLLSSWQGLCATCSQQ
jgi:hypothetical protein